MIDRCGQPHLFCTFHVFGNQVAVCVEGGGRAERAGNRHVINRLQDAEEHQANAHPGGEQHGEPAGVGEIGGRFLSAQSDLAPGADDQEQAEEHEDIGRAQEEPVEGGRQPRSKPAEKRTRLFGQRQGVKNEGYDGQPRNHEHGVVDVKTEGAELALDIVLSDLVIGVDQFRLSLRDGNACDFFSIGHVLLLSFVWGGVSGGAQPRTRKTDAFAWLARWPPCEAQM